MTIEDIERMAREAGLMGYTIGDQAPISAAITRFAALVRAQALEDAARACEAIVAADEYAYADECAAAIRAIAV